MNTVTLGPTHLKTTALGFGCGRLHRLPRNRERLAVLEAAFDCGVRHYDVARMYGLGAAEATLGRFLRDKREDIVLVTKFGIHPSRFQQRLARVQPLLRAAIGTFPALRRSNTAKVVAAGCGRDFSVDAAEVSLTTSLRELGVDHVDILLLHEPLKIGHCSNELVDWLDRKLKQGSIREYGVSGDAMLIEQIGHEFPALRRVSQFASDAFNRKVCDFRASSTEGVITFSGLSRVLDADTEVNARERNLLARYLMAKNVALNAAGVTLFSAGSPSRVAELVEAAYGGPSALPPSLLTKVQAL